MRKGRYRSLLPGLAWPALTSPQHAGLLVIEGQMAELERWPADIIRACQRRLLSGLLSFAAAHVERYAATPMAAVPDPDDPSFESFFRTLPVVTRRDVQTESDRFRATRLPRGHGRVQTVRTSGSTGTPLRADVSGLARTVSGALALRGHDWWGRDPSSILATIRVERPRGNHGPDGLAQVHWGWPTAAVLETGPAFALPVTAPFEKQLAWLEQIRPAILVTIPSALRELLELTRRRGHGPATIVEVATTGESVDDTLAADLSELWGARLRDTYSAKETGIIALQCPLSDRYHLMAGAVYGEVLDDHGEAVAPGAIGRLVVTRLHNFAMPLIRYEIGDLVRAAAPGPCRCGVHLPTFEAVLGRSRDMFRLPDGERFWPSFGRSAMAEIAPVLQHQLAQTGPDSIEVRLVVARPLSAGEEIRLRTLVQSRLPAPFAIRFRYPDGIPRGVGDKFEYFRQEWSGP